MPEGKQLEYKESLDPTDARDRLVLVKEIVAMSNADGGTLRIGVRNDGTVVGVPNEDLPEWDGAQIGDLLDSFLNPDHVEVHIEFDPDGGPAGRSVINLKVPQHAAPPLVICKDGNYQGQDSSLFRKGAVLVRHNTKVEPARRSDFLRWREELRNRILRQFQMVVEAPETAHLRMVGDEEVRDEPEYMLSRARDLFGQRREKLLDGDDLLYLFENRRALDVTDDLVTELLIQSALRRRATLYFWLGLLQPSPDRIWNILNDALGMSDRDKSDMSGAIPLIASMYLIEEQYESLIGKMADSSYTHIREAAAGYPTMTDAAAEIGRRRDKRVDGTALKDLGDDELLDMAEDLVSDSNPQRISRRMSVLGIEYLTRKLGLE